MLNRNYSVGHPGGILRAVQSSGRLGLGVRVEKPNLFNKYTLTEYEYMDKCE